MLMFIIAGSMITPATWSSADQRAVERVGVVERDDLGQLDAAAG